MPSPLRQHGQARSVESLGHQPQVLCQSVWSAQFMDDPRQRSRDYRVTGCRRYAATKACYRTYRAYRAYRDRADRMGEHIWADWAQKRQQCVPYHNSLPRPDRTCTDQLKIVPAISMGQVQVDPLHILSQPRSFPAPDRRCFSAPLSNLALT